MRRAVCGPGPPLAPVAELILFNKPYRVLSQFTDTRGRACLGDWLAAPGFYPAGRLDYDSEGLLLLTDDGALQDRIAHPRHAHEKTYLVQVEGAVDDVALERLRRGPDLSDGPTRRAGARSIAEPALWERDPPIRARRDRPTSWLELRIREGRNRQVRRMCAAVGFPVLRLVRTAVGPWSLGALHPGQARRVSVHLPAARGPSSAKIRGPRGTARGKNSADRGRRGAGAAAAKRRNRKTRDE